MRKAGILIGALALLLAAPVGASAENFYVDDGSAGGDATCPQSNPCQTIQQGLDAASNNTPGDSDVVNVAPGTYEDFGWTNASYEHITVLGAGNGTDPATSTIVQPLGPDPILVNMPAGVPGMQLGNLRVRHPASDDTDARRPLVIDHSGALIEDVVIDVRLTSATMPAITATNPFFSLTRVTVTKEGGTADAVAVSGSAPQGPTISDSVIDLIGGGGNAIEVTGGATGAHVSRSRISSTGSVHALNIRNTPLILDSSVVVSGPGASAVVLTADDGGPVTSTLRSSTIVGDSSLQAGTDNAGSASTIEVSGSILTGSIGGGTGAGTTNQVNCNDSHLSSLFVSAGFANCGAATNNTSGPADALFLSQPAGDYRLKAGSSAIDTGPDGALGLFSATDLARNPRQRDGSGDGSARVDKGAFEYQRLAPTASISGPDGGEAPANLSFQASFTDPDPGDTVSYRWTFSHNAGVIEGPSASVSFPSAGTHSVTLTVTDPTGLTGTATKTVTVTPPPGPTGPVATAGDDNFVLDALDNVFCGLAGNDTIDGGPGNDTLWGDQCNENAKRLVGAAAGDGNDKLIGNAGNDRLFGSGGRDKLRGNAGNDRLAGGSGNDTLGGDDGKDTLDGGRGNDRVSGGRGNDKAGGGDGNDTVSGGDGNDKLTGGKGRDKLSGGKGRNSYSAGAGDDTVSAANEVRETVDCGAGRRDKATVDRNDVVRNCETVIRRR